jgi:hypothetical protein
VACGVVQSQSLLGVFFDQHVAALFFNDGGDSDIGFPACVHGLDYQGWCAGTTAVVSFSKDEWLDFYIYH